MSSDRLAPRYRTLSVVAANVAAAAALAAQQNEQADAHQTHRRVTRGSVEYPYRSSASLVSRDTTDDDDGAADMLASFHSERAPSKRISWSTERYSRRGGSVSRTPVLSRSTFNPQLQITPTDPVAGPSDALERGRPLQRDVDNAANMITESPESMRRSSRGASRRGAGMVFLAVWALFGIGTLTGSKSDFIIKDRTRVGRVLFAHELPLPNSHSLPCPSR